MQPWNHLTTYDASSAQVTSGFFLAVSAVIKAASPSISCHMQCMNLPKKEALHSKKSFPPAPTLLGGHNSSPCKPAPAKHPNLPPKQGTFVLDYRERWSPEPVPRHAGQVRDLMMPSSLLWDSLHLQISAHTTPSHLKNLKMCGDADVSKCHCGLGTEECEKLAATPCSAARRLGQSTGSWSAEIKLGWLGPLGQLLSRPSGVLRELAGQWPTTL